MPSCQVPIKTKLKHVTLAIILRTVLEYEERILIAPNQHKYERNIRDVADRKWLHMQSPLIVCCLNSKNRFLLELSLGKCGLTSKSKSENDFLFA